MQFLRFRRQHPTMLPLGPQAQASLPLPEGAAGQWCQIAVQSQAWVRIEITDPGRQQTVRSLFLGPVQAGTRRALLHLPPRATQLNLHLFVPESEHMPKSLAVRFTQLSRAQAAWRLLCAQWRRIPSALPGALAGLPARLRRVLGQGALQHGERPPYRFWIAQYDQWNPSWQRQMQGQNTAIAALILGPAADEGAHQATLRALQNQWLPPREIHTLGATACLPPLSAPWCVILAPGEILPPHALACFAHHSATHPEQQAFYADTDQLTQGQRQNPLFKPATPDPWLRQTGLLTSGACLFNTQTLISHHPGFTDAPAWRLHLAESLPPQALGAISLILSHQPQAPLAAAPRRAAPAPHHWPSVTIIIPTAARTPRVRKSLQHLLRCTAYPNLEILLAISSLDPADRQQAAQLTQIARMPGLRILNLQQDHFNYAAVNNAAAAQAQGDLLLLLNDDVSPITPDWLQHLVTQTLPGPASADIVGPLLLYGNGTVQHAGVIIGLANLCEHAGRLALREDGGPHRLLRQDRQISAVTAACMLVRRSLYRQIAGMDEQFQIALNDVDFCLRAQKSGARIKFCAQIALYHYESLTLGRHYQGARASLELREVHLLRARWAASIAADPFYNPQASLDPGQEFQPAFPPRQSALSWIKGDKAALS